MNGLRANPPDPVPVPVTNGQEGRARTGSQTGSLQPTSPGWNRASHVQPREATVEKNTTRDLADFAKSTGPDTTNQLPKSLKSRLLRSSVDETARSDNSVRSGSATPTSKQQSFISRSNSSANRSGPRLQARDATLPRGEESSDLIDFIREGPPRDPREGTHRIPRNVAPFRNTKDSEDMVGVTSPKDRDLAGRDSVASTQASSVQGKSVQSSTNSRTGLLESTNKTNAKSSNATVVPPADRSFGPDDDAEDTMQPKRKQRRVRDPYAIDSDSEEEQEEQPTPKPQKARNGEESLMDFLRNTSPPPEDKFQPQRLMISPEQQAQAAKRIKQSSSIKGGQDRLRKSSPTNGINKTAPVPDGVVPSYQRGSNTGRPANSSPKVMGSRGDSLNPTQPLNASQRNPVQAPKIAPAPARTGLAPRPAGVGATADLADFLRNSAPPEPIKPPRSPSPIEEERVGFSRIFSRRRKVAA